MQLKTINDFEQFLSLKTDWDRLLESNEIKPLPLTHDWIQAWWSGFGIDREMNIICAYEQDRLCAIAPFMKLRSTYRRIPVHIMQLMANGHTPFSDIITHSSMSAEQRSSFIEKLISENTQDLIIFAGLSENSDTYHQLNQNLLTSKQHYGFQRGLNTPIIRINETWDEFYRSRSKKFRKGMNNKLNRFNKSGEFSIKCETIQDRNHPALLDMVQISKNSWKANIQNDLGSDKPGLELLMHLADSFGANGVVQLWMVYKGDTPVAYEIHLIHDAIAYPLRADYDENYKDYSPGSVLEFTALKSLFENGTVKQYYSCADNYWYLNKWTEEFRKHTHIEVFSKQWKSAALYYLEYKLIPILRPVVHKFRFFSHKKLNQPR